MKGRPRTPTAILKASGSWRAKGRADEPKAALAAPAPPKFLAGEALAEWKRQVEELIALGVLAKLDRAALTIWCIAWRDYAEASAGGPLKKGDTHKQRFLRAREARETLLKVASQFGFTPAARARLKATPEASAADPMEAFFQRSAN
jgi:P27 family predicted phage terminase small subunit